MNPQVQPSYPRRKTVSNCPLRIPRNCVIASSQPTPNWRNGLLATWQSLQPTERKPGRFHQNGTSVHLFVSWRLFQRQRPMTTQCPSRNMCVGIHLVALGVHCNASRWRCCCHGSTKHPTISKLLVEMIQSLLMFAAMIPRLHWILVLDRPQT